MHSNHLPMGPRARRLVQSSTPTKRRSRAPPSPINTSMSLNPRHMSTNLITPDSQSYDSWDASPMHHSSPQLHVPPEVVLGRRSDRSVVSEMGSRHSVTDVMEYHQPLMPFDEEMPMDEAQDTFQRLQRFNPEIVEQMRLQVEASQKEVERLTALLQSPSSVDAADRGGGGGVGVNTRELVVEEDDVSSLGGVEDSALVRLTHAIQRHNIAGTRPPHLSDEEKALWDVVQAKLSSFQSEALEQRRALERQVQATLSQLDQVRIRETELENKVQDLHLHMEELQKEAKRADDSRRHRASQSLKLKRLEEKLAETERLYQEAHAMTLTQQDEHDRSIRAIQRVLADATAQRDQAVEDLQNHIVDQEKRDSLREQNAHENGDVMASLRARAQRAFLLEREMESLKTMLQNSETDRESLEQDLEQKWGKIMILEQELNAAKEALTQREAKDAELTKALDETKALAATLESEIAASKQEMEGLVEREKKLIADVDMKNKQIFKLKRHLRHGEGEGEGTVNNKDATNPEEIALLQTQLDEKHASLENAKKIILSLEQANGMLAVDLRGKLKEKEEHVVTLQAEAADRKRTLDSLATELRDLQRTKGDEERVEEFSKEQYKKQQSLAHQLELAISELQSVASVYQAATDSGMTDPAALEQISRLLNETVAALKSGSAETMVENDASTVESSGSDSSGAGEDVGELNRQLDAIIRNDREAAAKDLRKELEVKNNVIKTLEAALKKVKDEMSALRRQMGQTQRQREEEEAKLKAEIAKLRGECKTNMEVLTKKEQELEVLRDSLEVGDAVGYISDDGSEADDDEVPPPPTVEPTHYGHSQAEALATLLVHGGSSVEMAGVSRIELDHVHAELVKAQREKEKATKELKAEKESLANAKMIISSLERANKSMLEDLRSRLQDSNAAIASLLDKSAENERSATSLRTELDKVKKEREKEAEAHKEEMKKLKDEALASAMRLAAKDREIESLRNEKAADAAAEELKAVEEMKESATE